MNFHRIIATFLTGLALAGATFNASAAAAVAVGGNGYSYAVLDADDLDQAKARALAGCRQGDSDCAITVWSGKPAAIALAKSPGGTTSVVRDTPEAARDAAMQLCRKSYKDCKFAALYWEPGGYWAAWASAKSGKELVAEFFTFHYGSEAEAREEALAGCEKLVKSTSAGETGGARCEVATRRGAWTRAIAATGGGFSVTHLSDDHAEAQTQALASCGRHAKPGEKCRLTQVDRNPGTRAQPKSFDKVFAQTELAKERRQAVPRKAAGRAGNTLTCTNRCVNGSCVRTFANGHTERWEAPRVFDPFTNNWKWDTSSCGG